MSNSTRSRAAHHDAYDPSPETDGVGVAKPTGGSRGLDHHPTARPTNHHDDEHARVIHRGTSNPKARRSPHFAHPQRGPNHSLS